MGVRDVSLAAQQHTELAYSWGAAADDRAKLRTTNIQPTSGVRSGRPPVHSPMKYWRSFDLPTGPDRAVAEIGKIS